MYASMLADICTTYLQVVIGKKLSFQCLLTKCDIVIRLKRPKCKIILCCQNINYHCTRAFMLAQSHLGLAIISVPKFIKLRATPWKQTVQLQNQVQCKYKLCENQSLHTLHFQSNYNRCICCTRHAMIVGSFSFYQRPGINQWYQSNNYNIDFHSSVRICVFRQKECVNHEILIKKALDKGRQASIKAILK